MWALFLLLLLLTMGREARAGQDPLDPIDPVTGAVVEAKYHPAPAETVPEEGKVPGGAVDKQVTIERATISSVGGRSMGTVIASTRAGDGIHITTVGGSALPAPVPMAVDLVRGRFFANVVMGDVAANPVPLVTLQVLSGGAPVVGLEAIPVPMEDIVTIMSATYVLRTRILTVSAASSMPEAHGSPGPVLTVTGTDSSGNDLGLISQVITNRSHRVLNLSVPPGYVTVTSSRGGKSTVPVTIR
jgi:hypothetical protein